MTSHLSLMPHVLCVKSRRAAEAGELFPSVTVGYYPLSGAVTREALTPSWRDTIAVPTSWPVAHVDSRRPANFETVRHRGAAKLEHS